MADSTRIGVKCSRCGGTKFEFPSNPKPNDTIKCVGCGATGKWGDMQKSTLDQTKKQVEAELKRIFKKR